MRACGIPGYQVHKYTVRDQHVFTVFILPLSHHGTQMGQNESLPVELRTLDFFDSAQRRALFDDEERAALTLMTSAIPNVSNTAPESRRALLSTLTSIGSRSGARLAAHPVELHLVTRNFCARMIRNSRRRAPGSTLFPDLLYAVVQQLRVGLLLMSPRATRREGRRDRLD